jgi:type IV secretion system protein VirD4
MHCPSHPPFNAAAALLLGWDSAAAGPFGFGGVRHPAQAAGPLRYPGDNHLIAFAPTGAGKGRGFLIPQLLTYPGPCIAIDIKGELYHVTARRRREMGQRVVVLDPFHLVTNKGDRLNPLDLLSLPGSSAECDSEMLASALSVGHEFASDRYWNDCATGLNSGLLAHIATTAEPAERNLNTLRKYLHHDDLDCQIATWLDDKAVRSSLARDEFVSYLTAPSEKTRPCILSTACTYVKALGSAEVAASLSGTSFDLADVVAGKPLTLYVVIPPEKLESHRVLLRLWLATLLTAVCRRKEIPARRTLFLLDEAAQLGPLAALRQAVTLLRGSGVQVFTFWQDLSQLKLLYPQDWPTILNNSGVLALFGLTRWMLREWGEVLGDAGMLSRLGRDEALVCLADSYHVVRRLDYLRDPMFAGLFDPNPRFRLHPVAAASGPEQGER